MVLFCYSVQTGRVRTQDNHHNMIAHLNLASQEVLISYSIWNNILYSAVCITFWLGIYGKHERSFQPYTHSQFLFPECNPSSVWQPCTSDQGMMHFMLILSIFSLHLQILMITVGVMAHSMFLVESLGTLSMRHSSMLVFTDDMNGYQQEASGWMDMTVHNGWWWNTANASLRPALRRRNLQTGKKAMIMRILFEKNRAIIGVEYHQDNMVRRVRATNKEVILCGGAINSPQLLMLSVVSNANDLEKLVFPVVTNYLVLAKIPRTTWRCISIRLVNPSVSCVHQNISEFDFMENVCFMKHRIHHLERYPRMGCELITNHV